RTEADNARERRAAREARIELAAEILVRGSGSDKSTGDAGATAEIRCLEKISFAGAAARRAANNVGRLMGLPLERATFFRCGLRNAHGQPARLERIRTEVHRRDHERLGRQSLC